MKQSGIPFSRPAHAGRESEYVNTVLRTRALQGNGEMTKACASMIASASGTKYVNITHSCTAALEVASLVLDLRPGDEVIMPSFAFASIANPVVLRGATPVFVDIRPDTLNLDEGMIEAAITDRTRAIYVVHYAGVASEMDAINAIARSKGLVVVEDAAQAYLSRYKSRSVGGLATIGCFSFHETKNIVSGEGGAFVTNDENIARRAQILCEKGTNRRAFLNGEVDKYTWIDVGSSYNPSELVAAFLRAQLETAEAVTCARIALWNRYYAAFELLDARGIVRRPIVPEHCMHNGHLFYLLLSDLAARDRLIGMLREDNIVAPFHYVPLHSSPAGRIHGRTSGRLARTEDLAGRLVRLPLFSDMGDAIERVIDRASHHIGR